MKVYQHRRSVGQCAYHLVLVPKYRHKVFVDEQVKKTCEIVLSDLAKQMGCLIQAIQVMDDHVHIFVEVPPKYSPARVVQIMKSISAREVFKKFPNLREQLWAGEMWNDGYFVRSVGDKVTADIIRRYIEYQTHEDDSIQLNMFDSSS